jgi:hypothetical protein
MRANNLCLPMRSLKRYNSKGVRRKRKRTGFWRFAREAKKSFVIVLLAPA